MPKKKVLQFTKLHNRKIRGLCRLLPLLADYTDTYMCPFDHRNVISTIPDTQCYSLSHFLNTLYYFRFLLRGKAAADDRVTFTNNLIKIFLVKFRSRLKGNAVYNENTVTSMHLKLLELPVYFIGLCDIA